MSYFLTYFEIQNNKVKFKRKGYLSHKKKIKHVFHFIKRSFKINELNYVIFSYPHDFVKEK
jgi:hypothetical protein